MKKEIMSQLHKDFESISNARDGVEFWWARDLQLCLGYSEWRNFTSVLKKAQQSCESANINISDHFVEVNKMVSVGSGAEREHA